MFTSYKPRTDCRDTNAGANVSRNYLTKIVEANSVANLQTAINAVLLVGPTLLQNRAECHLVQQQFYVYGNGNNEKHVCAMTFYFTGLNETTTFGP